MSNVPNVCVDIFSQMANLLQNFNLNSNLNTGGTQTFTHGDGFVSESTNYLNNTPSGSAANFEEQMNEYAFYSFIGMMLMFLVYRYVSTSMYDQRLNAKDSRNSQDNDSHYDNGHGGDGVY